MFKHSLIISTLLLGLTACQSTDSTTIDTLDLQGKWRIEQVQGQPTVDYSPASISFDTDGKLHGNNSCNNFFGQYQQQGQQLTLTPGGSTMKACVNALMQQEQKVMQAMPLVTKAQLTHGMLTLLGEDGKSVLVLSKID